MDLNRRAMLGLAATMWPALSTANDVRTSRTRGRSAIAAPPARRITGHQCGTSDIVPCYSGFQKPGAVALTFDDGPHAPVTEPLIDYLASNGIVATFFIVGSRAQAAPALVRRMRESGMVVGSHSYAHRQYDDLTPSEVRDDIRSAHSVISDILGEEPRLFRAPNDVCRGREEAIFGTLAVLKYTHYCSFDLSMRDWNNDTAIDIVDEARRAVRDDKQRMVNGRCNFDQMWLLIHDAYGDFCRMKTIIDWIWFENRHFSLPFAAVASSG